jgi:hypothetical protein
MHVHRHTQREIDAEKKKHRERERLTRTEKRTHGVNTADERENRCIYEERQTWVKMTHRCTNSEIYT